jgi:hypothetical protein
MIGRMIAQAPCREDSQLQKIHTVDLCNFRNGAEQNMIYALYMKTAAQIIEMVS